MGGKRRLAQGQRTITLIYQEHLDLWIGSEGSCCSKASESATENSDTCRGLRLRQRRQRKRQHCHDATAREGGHRELSRGGGGDRAMNAGGGV